MMWRHFFFHSPSPFPCNFYKHNNNGIFTASQFCVQFPLLYTVWSNASTEIRPEVTLRPLMTSCAKDYKGHSLMQTSFTETNTPAPTHRYTPAHTHMYTPAHTHSYTPAHTHRYTPAHTHRYRLASTHRYTPAYTNRYTLEPTNRYTLAPTHRYTPAHTHRQGSRCLLEICVNRRETLRICVNGTKNAYSLT